MSTPMRRMACCPPPHHPPWRCSHRCSWVRGYSSWRVEGWEQRELEFRTGHSRAETRIAVSARLGGAATQSRQDGALLRRDDGGSTRDLSPAIVATDQTEL